MSADDSTDRQLIARSRDGDTEAFRVLFERKHRKVYLIAYQILGDPSQAEEVVQEVFLSLWQHCGRYRPAFAVNSWLSRIAANRAIDRWRSGRAERRSRVFPEAIEPEPAAAAAVSSPGRPAEPEELTGWRELQAIWDELAGLLPPQQRAAFALREIEGLSTSEVAEAIGCSASTVRSHIAEARRTLQQALRERYPELICR